MCGILGVVAPDSVLTLDAVVKGLFFLERRGQDSCGVAFVGPDGDIHKHSHPKTINNEFSRELGAAALLCKNPRMAVAQTRYSTHSKANDPTSKELNSQPIMLHNYGSSCAAVHNGNIRDLSQLTDRIAHLSPSQATVDSRFLTELFMQEFASQGAVRAARNVMENVNGAYSFIYTDGKSLYAMRDPWGFRPLCIGTMGDATVLVSESSFFNRVHGKFGRRIEPGELVSVSLDGRVESYGVLVSRPHRHCFFEDIYFSSFLSMVEDTGETINQVRFRLGAAFCQTYNAMLESVVAASGIDSSDLPNAIVCSVTHTGDSYSEGVKFALHLPGFGVYKNRNLRFFINPEGKRGHDFTTDYSWVPGHDVLVVDDSIVRGDTIVAIYKELKDAGARRVYFLSMCPPMFKHCEWGIDLETDEEMIAHDLVKDGLVQLVDGKGFVYSNEAANRRVTELVQARIRQDCGSSYDPSDLSIMYMPIDVLRRVMPVRDCCYFCIDGRFPI